MLLLKQKLHWSQYPEVSLWTFCRVYYRNPDVLIALYPAVLVLTGDCHASVQGPHCFSHSYLYSTKGSQLAQLKDGATQASKWYPSAGSISRSQGNKGRQMLHRRICSQILYLCSVYTQGKRVAMQCIHTMRRCGYVWALFPVKRE